MAASEGSNLAASPLLTAHQDNLAGRQFDDQQRNG
jgi:hypothetical protein